ncbi:hypothetical protein [Flagellimonas meridianipacifica]|uniref:Uncharacterized protein n=1 Tax=Flagellimonas meridianipacifica TaxID=1080225 RepID=A0A2T0MGU9_9FLAO|nr:hypothetical protein [Allomuricauda pacifica]PRX56799.1 hypothetical protein CLV81_0797 [Allomuricauda pacifica]
MSRKGNKKKRSQRISSFEEGEIEFLISREFPERAREVENKFSGLQKFWISTNRTKAAILKLAEGDFNKIRELIKQANADPRDVIAYAEFPRSMQFSWSDKNNMTEEEKEEIRQNDWEEYQDWRNKGQS